MVDSYFRYIRELRTGVEGAVDRLMELWDPDGVFEFAGSPPVTGSFHGAMAIRTLYQNRFAQSGMKLQLRGNGEGTEHEQMERRGPGERDGREVALGVVDTEVHRVRKLEDKVVAGWTTVIGTVQGEGFQVSGSHSFGFRDGRISSLKIVVSPKPDTAPKLRMEELTVIDVGRLALAAWTVV